MAVGSGSTSILPLYPFPQAHGGSEAEGWSWVGGGSYANTCRPDPWRCAALAAVAPTMLPLSLSFNKSVLLRLDLLIWCYLKILTEVLQLGSLLLLELVGKVDLFILNKRRKLQACEGSDNVPPSKLWSACPLKLLRPSLAQFCAPCGYSWKQLQGRAIHHHPRRFEGGLLVDRQLERFWNESMVLQVCNPHMGIGGSFPNLCFSAQIQVKACHCEDGDFAQYMVIWLEAFMCGRNCSQNLMDSATEVATSLLMISNNWYANLSLHHILALEIYNLWFWMMIFVAQSLKCQNGNNIYSVSLWRKVDIIARILNHQLCSHTRIEIYVQQRSWNSIFACKTINSGSSICVQYSSFMSSKRTLSFLRDDHLVEDAVFPPFGLCHQRWTTTPLLLIPRFNGGDLLRLSSVMVPQNLQLNPIQPQVHTPDRPFGEPPTGHQLVWSMTEAFEDCRCSNIESVLSADERSLFGFIGNLRYQIHGFRSSFFHCVRLGTFNRHLTLCRRDMLYSEL